MIIRGATKADLPAIVEIYNAIIPGRKITADTKPVTVASQRRWFNQHTPNSRPLWVAEENEVIVGWLSFHPSSARPGDHATGDLSLYVAPHWQRKGIGRALLTQAIEQAPRLGLTTLVGIIFGHNDASLRLFEKFGFQRWSVLPGIANIDGTKRDLIFLGLDVVLKRGNGIRDA